MYILRDTKNIQNCAQTSSHNFVVVLILVILRQRAALLFFNDGKFSSIALLLQQGCQCEVTLVTSCITFGSVRYHPAEKKDAEENRFL